MPDSELSQDQLAEAEGAQEEEQRPSKDQEEEGTPLWMTTFADMMTLLLCFFVLIVSFSTMDVIKFRNMVGSLREAFGAVPSAAMDLIPGQISSLKLGEGLLGDESLTDEELEHELSSAVEQEGLTGDASLRRTDRGIVLSLRDQVLFEPGTAELRQSSLRLMRKVARVCRQFPRTVKVEGHTDNIPLQSSVFPSNWELSAARAGAVVRYLLQVEHNAPERFVVSGYAATAPIASNLRPEGRAENRRVEFVFSRGLPED
ncbi:MAG: OmpA family protein [Candidatus Eisenbacteria sp.]|nr:OmpA family protein [Candidatus Eisenbacteria bacterium]